MNLYASLCLQSASELMKLADEAGSAHNKDVTVAALLEATGGPWLLGEKLSVIWFQSQTQLASGRCLVRRRLCSACTCPLHTAR